MTTRRLIAFLALIFASIIPASAQTPEWIWHADTNATTVYLRKTFRTPPLTWNSRLTVSADGQAEIYLNGVLIARSTDWQRPTRSEVSVRLNQGENVIAVKTRKESGTRGVLVHLNMGGNLNLVSDGAWLANTNEEPHWSTLQFSAAHWSPATSLAPHGEQPWGDVLFRASATPPESIKVPEGFKVELLRSAEPAEGSWICMAFDDKGRIILSPQGETRPLLRLTLTNGEVGTVEQIDAPIHYAMGLLHAFDSLYVNGFGPQKSGLYRLFDANRNDRYEADELHFLKRFEGGSEHGYHALALGPDKKIYVLNGNGTKLPQGVSVNSPYRNYAEDSLTGARGEESDDGTRAPNCHVLRTDAEGKEWELFAGGMRNAYDMDFNADGELFTFDSDMEWDWGTPWYRPTRVLHLVSGGEYGWRDGTRMWADGYPDALPAVASVGIGSPTGVKSGHKSNFSSEYRRSLFVMDWSYGRILAVRLAQNRNGRASYSGKWETFLQGTPLNLTSLAFGPDGALYFITGGRGTQSGLYRVSHHGRKERLPMVRSLRGPFNSDAERIQRRQLESFHGSRNPEHLPVILKQLSETSDPHIQFAARVALETQPVESWQEFGISGKNDYLVPLWVALARVGPVESQLRLLKRLNDFPDTFIPKLRVMQLMLTRHPYEPGIARAILADLNNYPKRNWEANRELSRILLALNAPGAVSETVRLLQGAKTQEQQMHYIEQLRNVREGWSLADRKAYFEWFNQPRDPKAHAPEFLQFFKDVGRSYVDGAYFNKYLREFRQQSIATLSVQERRELEPILAKAIVPAQSIPSQNRPFVREWKLADLTPEIGKSRKADLARGRRAFVDAQCLTCHRFGNDGGMSGPELTGAGSKYSDRDLLESILEPSKIISDQYQDQTVFLKDGESFTGRLITDSDKEVVLEIDRVAGTRERIEKEKIDSMRPARLSPMPEGLANILTKEEILDLLAYLRSGLAPAP